MSDLKMGPVETRFAEIIWNREPVGSTELVRLAGGGPCWKKSTTYTVLKRLCDRGIFRNEGGTVTSPAVPGGLRHRPEPAIRGGKLFRLPARVYHGVYPAKKADGGRNRGAAKLIDQNRR